MMETVNTVVLFLHFMGLVMGMGAGMALSNVGPAIAKGNEDQRASLWEVHAKLTRAAHSGLGLMIITGLFLVGLKTGGLAAVNIWFWIKMGLVLALVISIALAASANTRLKKGDESVGDRIKYLGMASAIFGTTTILVAVIAFN